LFTIIRYFWQAVATLCGKGVSGEFKEKHSAFRLILILIKANLHGIKSFPLMLEKRRAVRKHFKVCFWDFCKLLKRFFLSPVEIAFKG
jgi:hypothetical protein